MTVHSHSYYGEYFGHPVRDLEEVVQTLRAQGKHLVWTAGDSSLDNKVWFNESHDAVNGYESILRPPIMKADVTYWLNKFMAERGSAGGAAPLAAVNTAIEATSLNDRACTRLLAQDRLIRDHIGPDDVLIVSVGGNDVALQPLLCTCASMCALVYCGGPVACIERCACAFPPNSGVLGELGCLACGVPNCVTGGLCGWPIGFPYMVDLFKHRVGNYVRRLVAKTKPRKVLICMIYHLDERATGSWADGALSCLCYDACPGRLQAGIEAAFVHATSQIQIDGTEVVPFPLFRVLDGKTSSDYCQRVEPSPQGGRKMAAALLDVAAAPAGTTFGDFISTPGAERVAR